MNDTNFLTIEQARARVLRKCEQFTMYTGGTSSAIPAKPLSYDDLRKAAEAIEMIAPKPEIGALEAIQLLRQIAGQCLALAKENESLRAAAAMANGARHD